MPVLSLTDTTPGSTSDAAANLNNNWTLIENFVNGTLDTTNLDPAAGITAAQLVAAVREAAGLNDGTSVRRGKSIISTEEARANVAYGLMTTPDRVSSVVLPTDGLLRIGYQAIWKESVDGAARAAIFIGSNQLKVAQLNVAAPAVQEARCPGAADTYSPLTSASHGLSGTTAANGTSFTGNVTTGQVLGAGNLSVGVDDPYGASATTGFGFVTVFAAAGTYDITVQFKASSGSVSVTNRKLWVEAIGF